MKKMMCLFSVVLCILMISVPAFSLDKWDNLLVESGKVFEEMTQMPEDGIPVSLLNDCYAVAIFPSTVSGGFVIGAQYGQGVIVAKDKATNAWTAPAVFNIAGGSFGWQIGGQATDIMLLIMNERGLDGLLQSKFKLGADAAIAAGPIGREAEAATDLQLKGGILSYSRSRGLFAGIKLEGSVISYNTEANTAIYGSEITARDILINKTVQPTEHADRLLKDLAKY